MKKIYFVLFISLILFTGCENVKEEVKSEYLTMKSELLKVDEFDVDNLPCDIAVNIDRVDNENISYELVISNPKENMHNIKALLVHNYYTEDVFPSVGLFDEVLELDKSSYDKIILGDTIKTSNDMDNLDLVLKLFIKYTDDEGNEKDVYYKTTK